MAPEYETFPKCGRCSGSHGRWDGCDPVCGRRLVCCDSADCLAFEEPMTDEEAWAALEHWMGHSYLSGCSRGAC